MIQDEQLRQLAKEHRMLAELYERGRPLEKALETFWCEQVAIRQRAIAAFSMPRAEGAAISGGDGSRETGHEHL